MDSQNQRPNNDMPVWVGVATLIVVIMVIIANDASTRHRKAETVKNDAISKMAPRLSGGWEKVDDPSFVLEFTAGRHLIITDNDNKYYTRYSFEESKVLWVFVENLAVSDCPRRAKRKDMNMAMRVWHAQLITMEVLPSGELLIANYDGPYGDEIIIQKMVGRYTPLPPTIITPAQASDHIGTRLTGVRSKDESVASQLVSLKADRDKLVGHLRSAGIRSSADLRRIPSIKPLTRELVELVQQISSAEKRHADYTAIIDQLESAQRRFKRREDLAETKLSEGDTEAIYTILAEVDEKLSLLDDELIRDLDTEAVLEQELSREPR